ncbi:hypothetical protein [Microbacterium sp.]|uniref:hypothetical protein n=1 Tax=Microbacterium sp. TaxID=51671 RepID=UPI0039E3D475
MPAQLFVAVVIVILTVIAAFAGRVLKATRPAAERNGKWRTRCVLILLSCAVAVPILLVAIVWFM